VSKEEKQHLSAEQIESVIETHLGMAERHAQSELPVEMRLHLATCEACQKLVSMQRRFDHSLQRLKEEVPSDATSDCPPERLLNALAAGAIPSEEAEKLLTHVVQCDHCGPLLRETSETFSLEEKASEEALLKSLRTGTPEWQGAFSRRLAAESSAVGLTPPRGLFSRSADWFSIALQKPWLYAIAAAIVLIAITTASLFWSSRPGYTTQLLARAYTERRTLEVRIPDAGYAPMRVERGAGASSMDKPASLLKAEILIAEHLRKDPNDPIWLEAKGRADLLDGNYESAIKSLQRALEAQPDSPPLLTDLGSAYFLRAEMTSSTMDYGAAIEFLGRSLAKSPDNPVALFNRALVCERMFLYTQAVDDWNHYLLVDREGPWANDARARLEELRTKIKEHNQGSSTLPWTASEVASLGLGDRNQLNSRMEDYLNVVVRRWLPEAFPSQGSKSQTREQTKAGLAVVADVERGQHQDTWLGDLLADTRSAEFPGAIKALSAGARANDAGDYVLALRESARSEILFLDSGNTAGVLRARLEKVFALHFSREGQECLTVADRSEPELKRHSYQWLQVQFHIERAICAGLMGNLGTSQRLADLAIEEARGERYVNLYLRALALSSDLSIEVGDGQNAWKKAAEGLNQFWSGNYRPMAGYNLYTDLDTVADAHGERFLQVAIWQQAITLLDQDPDLLLRAMARRWSANAAFSADMPVLAEKEFNEASRLFAAAPQSAAVQTDRAEAEIWMTRLQMARGDWAGAEVRMKAVEPMLRAMPNSYMAIHFYEVKGKLQFHQKHSQESDRSLMEAIRLAEFSLRSLSSESDRLAWRRETSDTYRDLVELKMRSGDAMGALELWEWYKAAPLRVNPQSAPVIDKGATLVPELHEVALALPLHQSSTVLSFSILADGLAIWRYDDRGLKFYWTEVNPSRVTELARRFTQLCSDPNSDLTSLRQSGRALYELLMGPVVEGLASDRTLVIELDERLGSVPMEALVDPEGRYLGDRFEIISSIGLYFSHLSNPDWKISRDSNAVVVSVPAGMNFAPLPEAAAESRAVARYFTHARLLEAGDAKREVVERALNESEVFHYAGHATSAGEKTGLVMFSSGAEKNSEVLDVGFLNSHRFPRLKLVVLSACATALGSAGETGDTEGLAQRFLIAGVPHVVGSRWAVDSVSANTFMVRFYRGLLSGEKISRAIGEAELSMRSLGQTAHPYYWSGFSAFGQE
jgi:CHAT domain-containing protein